VIEWMVLILLIPAILFPIVLLFGFAGCTLLFDLPEPFVKAFEVILVEERGHANECIVQRIEPVRLSRSGSEVRIVLQRPASDHLVLNGVFISPAAATGNAYDSAGAPKQVPAEYPLLVPMDAENGPFELPAVKYAFEEDQPVLIAFDIDSPGRVRRSESISTLEAEAFFGPAGEAAEAIRSAGYTARNRIYLVQRIEVR
jgi:hypothetical protein